MTNDPLQIFEPGFSGDGADKEARELIDAWRDEWHLEPEPEMDGGNSKVYESLVIYVASALTSAQQRGSELQREVDAKIAETHSATDCDGPDCGVVIAAAIRAVKQQ